VTGSREERRYVRIGLAAALIAATVFVAGRGLRQANAPAALPLTGDRDTPSLPSETGVFRLERQALAYRETPEPATSRRTLDAFHARRAFPGAPPVVPHPVADVTSFGGRTCLACHGSGGWVQDQQAYAPVTPHPELQSCLQCHVAGGDGGLFRDTEFTAAPFPRIGGAALPGSPPPIPHTLEMRNNCLACHAGPAAVADIRVTHPERVNCRQCHAESSAAPVFTRTAR